VGDRALFVTASLTAIAFWIAAAVWHRTKTKRDDRAILLILATYGIPACVVIVLVLLWEYRNSLSFPNAGNALAILTGAVFGSFSAKFVWSLFGPGFGRRDPLIGAGALALLSIAYSLAGQSNSAYREFLAYYKGEFEQYIESSSYRVRLEQFPAKCASWSQLGSDTEKKAN
jgi:hypothetical protein